MRDHRFVLQNNIQSEYSAHAKPTWKLEVHPTVKIDEDSKFCGKKSGCVRGLLFGTVLISLIGDQEKLKSGEVCYMY